VDPGFSRHEPDGDEVDSEPPQGAGELPNMPYLGTIDRFYRIGMGETAHLDGSGTAVAIHHEIDLTAGQPEVAFDDLYATAFEEPGCKALCGSTNVNPPPVQWVVHPP